MNRSLVYSFIGKTIYKRSSKTSELRAMLDPLTPPKPHFRVLSLSLNRASAMYE